MKDLLQKSGVRVLVFVNLFIVLNFVYDGTFHKHDLRHHSDFIEDLWAVQDSADILFLGDCSDVFYRDHDQNYLGISDYLQLRVPDHRIGTLSRSGFHGKVYHRLLQNVPDSAAVKTVVVTLNMRAFTAPIIWSKNENQLNKRLVMLEDRTPLFNRFMLSFQGYPQFSEEERLALIQHAWETDSLHNDNLPYETLWQWFDSTRQGAWNPPQRKLSAAETELAALYIQNYAFSIDTLTNPMLQYYDAIADLAAQRGWNLLFLLLPDNLEKAEFYGGPELRKKVDEKHELLQQRYERKGAIVLSTTLGDSGELFVEPNPNSHFTTWARYTLGYQTAEALFHQGWVGNVAMIPLPE